MKSFYFWKSLFLVKNQKGSWIKECLTLSIFNNSKYFLFKRCLLLLWFANQFTIRDFAILFFPIFFKFFIWFKSMNINFFFKYDVKKKYNFLFLISKTFFWDFYIYSFFLFRRIFDANAFFLIPHYFRFNIKFLVRQNQFLKNFLILFVTFYSDFVSNSLLLNAFFYKMNCLTDFIVKKNYLFQISEIFITKLSFLLDCPDLLLYNLQFLGNLQWKFCLDFFVFNLKENTKSVCSSYIAFQSFLNTSLYLARSFIFASNIASSSFNVLLLKNFNKVFFWVGEKKRDFYFLEYLFWSKQTIFFWKGNPYSTMRSATFRENFMFLPLYAKITNYDLNWSLHMKFDKYDKFSSKIFHLKLCFRQFNNFYNIF